MAVAEERITFTGGAGHELAGVLRTPDGEVRGGVLLAHCFTCSKDLHTLTRLSRALAREGWQVLRFDFTGIGESEGDFADKTVTRNVEDLVRAAAWLRERTRGPLCLFGHSLGGAAVLLAAHRIPGAGAVAVLNAPSTPSHLRTSLGEIAEEAEREGEAVMTIAGREFPVSAGFLADLDRHEQERRVAELDVPLLVVHAVEDVVVDVGDGEDIFAAATQPKSFVPLLDTDHLVGDRRRAQEMAQIVIDWFARMT